MLSQANLITKHNQSVGQGKIVSGVAGQRGPRRVRSGENTDGKSAKLCEANNVSLRKVNKPQFRHLLGDTAWATLPAIVRQRFSKHIAGDAAALYVGEIVETRFSLLGRLLAQLCRVIGAPLPLHSEAGQCAEVRVAEDKRHGGQRWTRIYESQHPHQKPQIIVSTKRFAGATGLEEYLGYGIGMALRAEAAADGITFTSDHYFIQLGEQRWKLPHWLAPGQTMVSHTDLGGGQFAFDLTLTHPILGELVHQHGVFCDG